MTLQWVPERKTVKNRVHPDLQVPDLDKAVTQLEALGAQAIQQHSVDGWPWVLMTDPEGNEVELKGAVEESRPETP